MNAILDNAMVAFSAAGLFAGAGGLFAFGLNWWAKSPKRYRLIMNAYAEGLKDGKAIGLAQKEGQ